MAATTLAKIVTVCGSVLALTAITRGGKLPRGSGWMDESVPGIFNLDADHNRFEFEPASGRTNQPPCRLPDADRLEPGWFANRWAGCNLSAYQPAVGSLLHADAIESPCLVPYVAPYRYALYSVPSNRRWFIVERTAASDRCAIWWSDAAEDSEHNVPFVQTQCVQMMAMARLAERAHLPHNRTFPPLGDRDLFRSMTSFIRGTKFLTEDLDGQINQRASMETVLGELTSRWEARQAESAEPTAADVDGGGDSPDDDEVEYVDDDAAIDRTDPLVEILGPDDRDGGSIPPDEYPLPPVVAEETPVPPPSSPSSTLPPPTKFPMRPPPDVYPIPKKVHIPPPPRPVPAPFPTPVPAAPSLPPVPAAPSLPTVPAAPSRPPVPAAPSLPPARPLPWPPVYSGDDSVENQPEYDDSPDYEVPPGRPTATPPRGVVPVTVNPSKEAGRPDTGNLSPSPPDTPEPEPVIGTLPLAVGAVGIIGIILVIPLAVIVCRQWSSSNRKTTKTKNDNQATAAHVTIHSSEQPLIEVGGRPRGEREHTYINMAR